MAATRPYRAATDTYLSEGADAGRRMNFTTVQALGRLAVHAAATGVPVRVVIAAGGLGTRVASWVHVLPRVFQPVDGRPALLSLLGEVAGTTRAVGQRPSA